jgi:demethoxyubiquinone hydroxylase (CLK1/Coq7/Cat5 family)
MGTVPDRKTSVDQLNSFLRGELSAVETYRIALDKLDKASFARMQLQTVMSSHQQRVDALRGKIMEMGGRPAESSGAWGVFAKAIEGSASVLGDKIAIDALESGEDHGLADYRQDLKKLDGDARRLIVSQLLPKQEETHRTMSTLKKQLH